MPCFHPPPELMIDHAVGGLDPWASRLIDLHSRFCPCCRDALALSQAVGGVLFADLAPVPVSDDEVAGILARLDDRPLTDHHDGPGPADEVGLVSAVRPGIEAVASLLPSWAQLLQELAIGLDPAWWPWSGAGHDRLLLVPPGAQAGEIALLVLPPAAVLPVPLQAAGGEMPLCLILDGMLLTGGSAYHQGDFWSLLPLAEQSGAERAVFAGADGCLCLVVPGVN